MRQCADGIGLWDCLWGTVLIILVEVGRPAHRGVTSFPGQGFRTVRMEELSADRHACVP